MGSDADQGSVLTVPADSNYVIDVETNLADYIDVSNSDGVNDKTIPVIQLTERVSQAALPGENEQPNTTRN